MPDLQWLAKDVATVSAFFSPEECDTCIRLGEGIGYEIALVTTQRGMVIMEDVRNNDRVMMDDPERAAELWQQIAALAPKRVDRGWYPVGVNERFRFYRYDVGQQFDWHADGYFERDNGERSFFTFMIYLNDDFEGGATLFSARHSTPDAFVNLRVKPTSGTALLFRHPLVRKGQSVTRGRKYVLRTDIMYARMKALDTA
jgi:predicted 2-oxoglutarate/Fe(II)-dependent dioxygenase YbiX